IRSGGPLAPLRSRRRSPPGGPCSPSACARSSRSQHNSEGLSGMDKFARAGGTGWGARACPGLAPYVLEAAELALERGPVGKAGEDESLDLVGAGGHLAVADERAEEDRELPGLVAVDLG